MNAPAARHDDFVRTFRLAAAGVWPYALVRLAAVRVRLAAVRIWPDVRVRLAAARIWFAAAHIWPHVRVWLAAAHIRPGVRIGRIALGEKHDGGPDFSPIDRPMGRPRRRADGACPLDRAAASGPLPEPAARTTQMNAVITKTE